MSEVLGRQELHSDLDRSRVGSALHLAKAAFAHLVI